MKQPLEYLQKPKNHDCLIVENSQEFYQIATELYSELMRISHQSNTPKIILAEREPVKFLAGFIAACAAKCQVFLCNPDWGKNEWEQVFNLVQPDIVWGIDHINFTPPITNYPFGVRQFLLRETTPLASSRETRPTQWLPKTGLPHQLPISNSIMIPTGGSSGKIKFAIHTWETLTASVKGFTEYFQLKQVNSFCVLPLYHVSGLMQFLRSFTTGGKLVIMPFKEIEIQHTHNIINNIYNLKESDFFISLVPTQLQRLLQNPELTKWLSQFKTVLLGGAPAWEELLEKARFHQIRLAPTYGMTETASQIATLKPDDFLKGKNNNGQILPHAKITIDKVTGNINIQAKSLALGYYPQLWENRGNLLVDDIGFLDGEGYLHIIGRSSNKIISGGENIYPEEIEAVIKQTNLVIDVCVIGIPDQVWGQALTAIYVPQHENISSLEITDHLKNQLSKFKIPKHWISLDNLPRNNQGKINREQLQKIAADFVGKSYHIC